MRRYYNDYGAFCAKNIHVPGDFSYFHAMCGAWCAWVLGLRGLHAGFACRAHTGLACWAHLAHTLRCLDDNNYFGNSFNVNGTMQTVGKDVRATRAAERLSCFG